MSSSTSLDLRRADLPVDHLEQAREIAPTLGTASDEIEAKMQRRKIIKNNKTTKRTENFGTSWKRRPIEFVNGPHGCVVTHITKRIQVKARKTQTPLQAS